ncbi:MAG: sugar ABC transporter permease [Erysipelotrichia bacterium]|nr:sugar ABC transporter permease [Erysipelotrichia bacterium]NCC54180.1 sugar ABC transporter permease [Erysipelotrichia bacterium]
MNKKKERRRFIIICLTPAILLFTVFMILPTLNVFWMSSLKWGGLSANKEFVGFNNFSISFQDPNFVRAAQNTVFIIAIVTIVTLALAILFASILVREKIKGQNFFRIIFYIPNILSVVVIASIFTAIYDPSENGLINSILSLFNGEGWQTIKFLGDEGTFLYSIAGAMIWQGIGYYMVMYMASMSSIPEHLYEASALEGAGKIRQFFSITLPLVWDNIRTTLTFFIISCINLSFLFIKVFGSGPGGSGETLLSYMYKQAYNNASYGYGMAIGVVVFIFSFILSALVNKATERDVLEF